jgi:hypothetical protein
VTVIRAFALLIALTGAFGQPPEPRFDVASVKPSPPDAGNANVPNPTPDRFEADNLTTRTLIALAWDVRVFQVSGGPAWLDSQRYDVAAKPDGNVEDQHLRRMVRTLLAERFQLQARHPTKEMPVFTLEIAKGGPKLERPVLNRTGIDRAFDVDLEYTPERNPEPRASLFTAIQEQLCLKLESRRALSMSCSLTG